MENVKMYLVKADRSAQGELDLRKAKLGGRDVYSIYKEVNGEVTHFNVLQSYSSDFYFSNFITFNLKGEKLDENVKGKRIFFNHEKPITKKNWDKFKKMCKKHFIITDITGIDLSQHINTLSVLKEELKNSVKEKDELISTFKTTPFTTKSGKYRKINYKNKLFLPYGGGAYLSNERTYLIAEKRKGYGERFKKLNEPITYYGIYGLIINLLILLYLFS